VSVKTPVLIPENKEFWNELCGTGLFSFLGLKEINEDSLKVFDDYYKKMYPYLFDYLTPELIAGKDILEIGLGFGTVGQVVAPHSKSYTGVDYALNPVHMTNDRMRMIGTAGKAKAQQGDARNLDFPDASFDTVISIGCLHHTGDTEKSVDEVYRVLRPGGTALIMLYNRRSFRRLIANPYKFFISKKRRTFSTYEDYVKGAYDANKDGKAAPIVDFFSRGEIRRLFRKFKTLKIDKHNFDNYQFKFLGKEVYWPREKFLNNVARILGLDLYIRAKK
jgi:SAM-dependent methyltransferase